MHRNLTFLGCYKCHHSQNLSCLLHSLHSPFVLFQHLHALFLFFNPSLHAPFLLLQSLQAPFLFLIPTCHLSYLHVTSLTFMSPLLPSCHLSYLHVTSIFIRLFMSVKIHIFTVNTFLNVLIPSYPFSLF